MNGVLQSYFLKTNQIKGKSNSITQKPYKPNLSFTRLNPGDILNPGDALARNALNPEDSIDALNIAQSLPIKPYAGVNEEKFDCVDLSTPFSEEIGNVATGSIVNTTNNTTKFRFEPSKCHSKEKEKDIIFSTALYTAIIKAQKNESNEVTFVPSNEDEKNLALKAGFKAPKNNMKELIISKKDFGKVLKTLETTMRENDAEMKKVDKISDKFKPVRIPLTGLSITPVLIGEKSKAALILKEGKIYLKNSENNHNIRINKLSLQPNNFKELKSGDTIILGNEIYIFNASKNPELRFIKYDNNNSFVKLFPSGVSNLTFNQELDDCYFFAALKSASKNPDGAELIAKMIETNSDRNYKVIFPGFPKESFIVNSANIKDSYSVDRCCLGVKILEHAFYMLKERLKWQVGTSDNTNKSEWLRDGIPYEVLFILTGGQPYSKETPYKKDGSGRESFAEENRSNKDIAQETIDLLDSIKDNFIVCAGTCRNFDETQVNGMKIYPTHGYSVLNINPTNKTLSIFNPLDGLEKDIKYDDFFKYFYRIDFVELKEYQD